MGYQNKLKYIFDECKECGKELNEMEKEYCRKMATKTNCYLSICSACLDKEYDGKWPILSRDRI